MVITERDLELFKKLSSHGMLSTGQINSSKTTVLRRLRSLEKENYLKRLLGLESQETLWILTIKGAESASVGIAKSHWSKIKLDHDFKLLAVRLCLEEYGVAHSWKPEHVIRSDIFRANGIKGVKEKLIPDGLMGIEVNGIKESIAIELELTLKNKDKLRQTLRRYQIQPGIHAVWYIAPSVSILRSVTQIWYSSSGNSSVKLYCSLLEEVMKCPLTADLYGSDSKRAISEVWKIKPAQPPAQGVSTPEQNIIENKPELTDEIHAPFLEEVS